MNKKILSILTMLLVLCSCVHRSFDTPTYQSYGEIKFRVLTMNILYGGVHNGPALSETVDVIKRSEADIVVLQEQVFSASKIAKALGWNGVWYSDFDNAIISRYKITETYENGARVEFRKGRQIALFGIHLKPYPYEPYDLRDNPGLTAEALEISAERTRAEEMGSYLKRISILEKEKIPVLLAGDFNEPSHLDWTEKSVEAGIIPISVKWPVSLMAEEAGLIDAYRTIKPDPVMNPGYTWTPYPNEDEVLDRIDMIYFKGEKIRITDCRVIGPEDAISEVKIEPYPSDHRGVIADFIYME